MSKESIKDRVLIYLDLIVSLIMNPAFMTLSIIMASLIGINK